MLQASPLIVSNYKQLDKIDGITNTCTQGSATQSPMARWADVMQQQITLRRINPYMCVLPWGRQLLILLYIYVAHWLYVTVIVTWL